MIFERAESPSPRIILAVLSLGGLSYALPAEINYRAAALMTVGISVVLLAITKTSTWGWGSPKTLDLLAICALVSAAWVRAELCSREPLVDMRMMAIRGVWTTNTVAFLMGVGMYSSFVLLPELVQEPASAGGFGASVTSAGLSCCPPRSRSWPSGRWPGASSAASARAGH